MSDPGTENLNMKVIDHLSSAEKLKQLVARFDIHCSNSMVEAVFHSLKNNYLYHQKMETFTDVKRKVNFYFEQYNKVIPHGQFRGATPWLPAKSK